MRYKREGRSQAAAAAKAGISERSARRIDRGEIVTTPQRRIYRTRTDPFSGVWEDVLVPLLEAHPKLQATTLLAELQRRYGDNYPDRLLRTLQRRVSHWRAVCGPDREIIFRQQHPPGRQGLSDFTDGTKLGVSIDGQPFKHLLYHFRLAYSGWEHVKAIAGGESFTALCEGLQEALWQLGGAPLEHRTDRLSAAYRNLKAVAEDDTAERYAAFLDHYGMKATRNNPGIAHENGSIEAAHGGLRRRLDDALCLRGSRDFKDLAAYQAFIQEQIRRDNQRRREAVSIELAALKALPPRRTCDYAIETVSVTTSSTVRIRSGLYTVPSRLIGARLKAHIYDDRIDCFLGSSHVVRLPRLTRRKDEDRPRHIDYRHLISGLLRKPQAFRHSVFREDLFPTNAFRRAWQLLDSRLDQRQACRTYVGLLHLAATYDCEAALSERLARDVADANTPDLEQLQDIFIPKTRPTDVDLPAPDVTGYDVLIGANEQVPS